jgi:hypothetical protein
MIIARPWALFRADFPSDMIDEGHGEPIHGGKNVARAIGEILQHMGCTVAEPEYGGEHGWSFVFHHGRVRFWMEVSEGWGDGHALRWEDWPPLLSASQSHLQIMLELNDQLKRDGRFHDIAWYGDGDVGDAQNGQPLPVIGELAKAPEMPPDQQKLSFIQKLLAPVWRRPNSGE